MPKKTALATLPANDRRAIATYSADTLHYAKASKAKNTTRAYSAAWREFETWAQERGAAALPADPQTVAAYLSALAKGGAKFSTISVKRAAVRAAHRTAGHVDPTAAEIVRLVMAGIGRAVGTAPAKKAPLTADLIRQLVSVLDRETLPGQRDAALLLIGFAGAFRRSELVALNVEDLRFERGGLKITVRRSKTDQTGEGLIKQFPQQAEESICPVRALRGWLDAAGIKSGPVFRRFNRWGGMGQRLTDWSVAEIVKATAKRAGLDARQFSGHSLRSGFITSAANASVESRDIMAQTGHKAEATMRGYIQDAGKGARRAVQGAFGETGKK